MMQLIPKGSISLIEARQKLGGQTFALDHETDDAELLEAFSDMGPLNAYVELPDFDGERKLTGEAWTTSVASLVFHHRTLPGGFWNLPDETVAFIHESDFQDWLIQVEGKRSALLEKYDPMKLPFWTPLMVVEWITHRKVDLVRILVPEYWEKFSSEPQSSLSLHHLYASYTNNKKEISAYREFMQVLTSGSLTVFGIPSNTNVPVEIPAEHLAFISSGSDTQLNDIWRVGDFPHTMSYSDLKAPREDVLNRWPVEQSTEGEKGTHAHLTDEQKKLSAENAITMKVEQEIRKSPTAITVTWRSIKKDWKEADIQEWSGMPSVSGGVPQPATNTGGGIAA